MLLLTGCNRDISIESGLIPFFHYPTIQNRERSGPGSICNNPLCCGMIGYGASTGKTLFRGVRICVGAGKNDPQGPAQRMLMLLEKDNNFLEKYELILSA